MNFEIKSKSDKLNMFSFRKIFNTFIVISTVMLVLTYGIIRPHHNWDMIAYVATAHKEDGLHGSRLSEATYNDIRGEVSSDLFDDLTSGNYRLSVFSNPISLEQQIPFYEIKIAYIEAMRLLHTLGVPYPKTTYVISAVCSAISIVLIAAFCGHFSVSVIWVPALAAFSGYFSLSAYSTPDAMASMVALAAILTLIKKSKLAFLFGSLLPIVRAELIILSIIISYFLYLRDRRFAALAVAPIAMAFYFLINHAVKNYGWAVLYNFTFMGIDPFPQNMRLATDPWLYLKPYFSAAQSLFSDRHFVAWGVSVYIFINFKMYKKLTEDTTVLFVVPALYSVAHIALFPVYDERFFAFPVSLICVGLLAVLVRLRWELT